MSKKYQEDLRRLVGLEDGGKSLDEKQELEDIASSRGVAYFSASGNVSSGNNVPDDIQEAQTDEAENGDGTDGNSTDGSGTGTTRNNQYCNDGSIRPYSTGLCPEDIAAATTPVDSLGTAAKSGATVQAIGGLFDCTNGDSVRISFGFDGLPGETASDPTDPNNINNLITDPETGEPILDENGEAQYDGSASSSACIPPDGWERCDCYQPEKRGGLKDGWDSVQMWREAQGCGQYDESTFNYYNTYSPDERFFWTAPNVAAYRGEPTSIYYDANLVGYRPYEIAYQMLKNKRSPSTYYYVPAFGNGGADQPSQILPAHTGYTDVPQAIQWCWYYYLISNGSYRGSECMTPYSWKCSSYPNSYMCGGNQPEIPEECDTYPEECENGNTDDESCHPLEIVQEEQCCEPYSDYEEGVFLRDQTQNNANLFFYSYSYHMYSSLSDMQSAIGSGSTSNFSISKDVNITNRTGTDADDYVTDSAFLGSFGSSRMLLDDGSPAPSTFYVWNLVSYGPDRYYKYTLNGNWEVFAEDSTYLRVQYSGFTRERINTDGSVISTEYPTVSANGYIYATKQNCSSNPDSPACGEGVNCQNAGSWPVDGTQDYNVDQNGVAPASLDTDIPQENAETTAEKTFCNDSGQEVKIVQGLNGGTVIRNDTTGVHYYRDPQTGKLSFFDNTELSRYLPE